MIARSDVHRTTRLGLDATLYISAAVLSAGLAGTALGLIGSAIPIEVRLAALMLGAVVACTVASIELLWRHLPVPQCDRETPRAWLARGRTYAALRNGFALGHGARTRIGFSSWYVIPAAALLMGQPLIGALVYGTYGLARASSALGWLAADRLLSRRLRGGGEGLVLRVLDARPLATVIDAGALAITGVMVILAVG